jgi:hypothetical protein
MAFDVDLDLIRRYNRSLPRYTSYPTAPHFTEDVGQDVFGNETRGANAADEPGPLSLYLHLPFCRQLCYYCGCHMKVTQDPERVATYLRHLTREIDLLAPHLAADRRVLIIGGGIIGLSLGWTLVRAGRPVANFEAETVGHGASEGSERDGREARLATTHSRESKRPSVPRSNSGVSCGWGPPNVRSHAGSRVAGPPRRRLRY